MMKRIGTVVLFLSMALTCMSADNLEIEGDSISHAMARKYQAWGNNNFNKLISIPAQVGSELASDVMILCGKILGDLKEVPAEERKNVIDPSLQKVGLNPEDIKVVYATISSQLFSHFSTRNHIIIDEKEFVRMSPQEQEFVIAHEAVHIKHKDLRSKIRRGFLPSVAIALVPDLVAGAVTAWGSGKLILMSDRDDLDRMLKQLDGMLKKAVVVALITRLVASYFFGKSESIVSRAAEKRCDLEAAQQLGTPQGGIRYFTIHKKLHDDVGAFRNAINAILKRIVPILDSHPSHEERLAYLEQFAKEHGIALVTKRIINDTNEVKVLQ